MSHDLDLNRNQNKALKFLTCKIFKSFGPSGTELQHPSLLSLLTLLSPFQSSPHNHECLSVSQLGIRVFQYYTQLVHNLWPIRSQVRDSFITSWANWSLVGSLMIPQLFWKILLCTTLRTIEQLFIICPVCTQCLLWYIAYYLILSENASKWR